MPTYEYYCKSCGEFEIEQRITEDVLSKCPTCKKKVKRLISASSFILKGNGWYKDGYSSNNSTIDRPLMRVTREKEDGTKIVEEKEC